MKIFNISWWKILCIILLIANIVIGFLYPVPIRPILGETIRNYFFHPPLWIAMMFQFIASFYNSIRFLRNGNLNHDFSSRIYASTGLFFGLLGLCTGMFWAKYTWGTYWTGDPKLSGTVIGLLIYSAYFVLRASFYDMDKRAKVSAVYNIFGFIMFIPSVFVIPRMLDSLHPGSTGNPVINPKDVDSGMFIVFWTVAVPGFVMLSIWISSLQIRVEKILDKEI